MPARALAEDLACSEADPGWTWWPRISEEGPLLVWAIRINAEPKTATRSLAGLGLQSYPHLPGRKTH